MTAKRIRKARAQHVASTLLLALTFLPQSAVALIATTTLNISICYNGIIDVGEVCDDGLFNTGAYGSTSAQKHCNATCSGFGPWCGDGILQALYSEQCEDRKSVV